MALNKIKIANEYSKVLGRFYASTPKAVFAAIAFSYADRLFAKGVSTEVVDCLLAEWTVLHENGIVPQKPPKKGRTHDYHAATQ